LADHRHPSIGPDGADAAGYCLLGLDDVDDRQRIRIDNYDPTIRKEEETVAFIRRYDLHNSRRQPFKANPLGDFGANGHGEVDFFHRCNVDFLYNLTNFSPLLEGDVDVSLGIGCLVVRRRFVSDVRLGRIFVGRARLVLIGRLCRGIAALADCARFGAIASTLLASSGIVCAGYALLHSCRSTCVVSLVIVPPDASCDPAFVFMSVDDLPGALPLVDEPSFDCFCISEPRVFCSVDWPFCGQAPDVSGLQSLPEPLAVPFD
jgi:hypothetical protein